MNFQEEVELANNILLAGMKAGQEIGRTDPHIAAIVEALIVILPMAKGYAAEHQVGNNQAMVEQAETALGRYCAWIEARDA